MPQLVLGCSYSWAVTDCLQGPLENLLEHIDDPFGNNGLTLETASKFTPSN